MSKCEHPFSGGSDVSVLRAGEEGYIVPTSSHMSGARFAMRR